MSVRLLGRQGCGLCAEAAQLLTRSGVAFEEVDVDSDPALVKAYGEAVPVIFVGGDEIARAPIDATALLASLSRAGIASAR